MPESMRFTPMTQRFAEPARVGPVCADPAGSRTEFGAIMVAFPPPGHRPRPWPRQPGPVANPVARPRSRPYPTCPDPTRCGTIPARTEVRQRSPPPPRRTSSDGRRQVMPPITANPRSVTTVDGDCRDPDPGGPHRRPAPASRGVTSTAAPSCRHAGTGGPLTESAAQRRNSRVGETAIVITGSSLNDRAPPRPRGRATAPEREMALGDHEQCGNQRESPPPVVAIGGRRRRQRPC
jgi:hypothetical protein